MIKASEAKGNVIEYRVEEYNKVYVKVSELLEVMSKSIEFHSKHGIDHIDFCPYDKTRFPSCRELEVAEKIFSTIFEEHGYTITNNSALKNILSVYW